MEIPTEDIALLATVSHLPAAGETTDSLLFDVALGGFINISPVSGPGIAPGYTVTNTMTSIHTSHNGRPFSFGQLFSLAQCCFSHE